MKLPLATVAAAGAGGIVAVAFLLVPAGLLEGAVLASGLPAVLAAAEPPLGFTARVALALAFGGGIAGFAWFGLPVLIGSRTVSFDRASALLRRVDRHADAPPRPPLFANRELGTPFLDVKAPAPAAIALGRPDPAADEPPPVEQALPVDLDQPMARFDRAAVRDVPLTPPPPVAPLARPQLIDPGDRFETFELTPVARPARSLRVAPAEVAPPEPTPPATLPATLVVNEQTESTVHALLERLERGVAARERKPAPATGSLQDTLGDLRRLATGG